MKFSETHDDGEIILGPQKRSWNAGCHVSHTKRTPQDPSHSKGHKASNETKFPRSDFKRESKAVENNPPRSFTFYRSKVVPGSQIEKGNRFVHLSIYGIDRELEPE